VTGIVLALASVGFWSLSSHLDKHFVESVGSDSTIVRDYIVGLFLSLLVFSGIVIVRGFPPLDPFMATLLVIAGIFEVMYLRFYYRALDGDDTSRVLTLFSFIPLFSLGLAYVALHETVAYTGLLGGAIIVAGNIFVSWDPRAEGSMRLRTVWLIALASLLLALNYTLYRFAHDATGLAFVDLLPWIAVGGMIGSFTTVIASAENRRDLFSRDTYSNPRLYGLMIANHTLDQLGLLCAYAAYLFAPVFVVASIISALPLFSLVFSSLCVRIFSLLPGSPLSRGEIAQRWVAILVTMVGLALIQRG
jgi:uncharacterized membrane protein